MKKIVFLLVLIGSILKTEAQSSVFKVVDSLLLKGNYQEALKLLSADESNVQYLEKSANIYQSIGDFNRSISCYKKAIENSEKESLKINLAKVYSAAGNKKAAIKLYEYVLGKDSSNLLVANSLGKLYLSNRKIKSAEKLFKYLEKKDKQNPGFSYQLGTVYKVLNKPFKMGQSFLDAFNKDTLHIKSIYELAKFFKKLKDRDSSYLFIEKGLQIDSLNINFLQLKASALYFQKKFSKSIPYLETLDSLKFKSVNTYEMHGMCYFNLKQLDSAEVFFKRALKLEFDNAQILYRLSSLEFEKKNYQKAEIYATQAIFMNKPDFHKHYLLLGLIAKDQKKYKQAISYFEKSISNNYRSHKALFELAITCDGYYKDSKIALKHYEKYLERFSSRDKEKTDFATKRSKAIRKKIFADGEIVD